MEGSVDTLCSQVLPPSSKSLKFVTWSQIENWLHLQSLFDFPTWVGKLSWEGFLSRHLVFGQPLSRSRASLTISKILNYHYLIISKQQWSVYTCPRKGDYFKDHFREMVGIYMYSLTQWRKVKQIIVAWYLQNGKQIIVAWYLQEYVYCVAHLMIQWLVGSRRGKRSLTFWRIISLLFDQMVRFELCRTTLVFSPLYNNSCS